jgi:hypothetical protein
MRRLGLGCMCLWLGVGVGLACAQEAPQPAPAVTLGPPVTLGAPIAASPRSPVIRAQSSDDGFRVSTWAASLTESQNGDLPGLSPLRVPEAATPPPGSNHSVARADDYPGVNYVPTPQARPRVTAPDSRPTKTSKSYFGEFFDGWFQHGEDGMGCFESDHCFVTFISPVTNPFIAEDPRSLTEIRPIFMFQSIPNSNWIYKGGNAEFLGFQARLALTEHWSIVMNKLGGVWINPGGDSALGSENGFSEVWIGPKWTFLRNTDTGTLGAAGVTFQIPAGSNRVAQDTGSLSVLPYASFGQNFGRSSIGSFNVIDVVGYNFRTDNTRSEYFVNSLHLDYDVGNLHKFFPLVELNWFAYTRSGKARALAFEGADLVNFGSTDVNSRNNLTIAPGMRYRVNDHFEAGAAVEFPLVGTRDLNAFRLTLDVIFRY